MERFCKRPFNITDSAHLLNTDWRFVLLDKSCQNFVKKYLQKIFVSIFQQEHKLSVASSLINRCEGRCFPCFLAINYLKVNHISFTFFFLFSVLFLPCLNFLGQSFEVTLLLQFHCLDIFYNTFYGVCSFLCFLLQHFTNYAL